MRILVTDGAYTNSLAIIRDLGAQNFIGITSPFSKYLNLCVYSKYVKNFHKIKSFTKSLDDYAMDLLDAVKEGHYDFLIPVGLESCLAVSKHKDEFTKETKLAIADWEAMQIAYQRDRAINLAMELGVPIPHSIKIETEDDINQISRYPVVFKHVAYGNDFVKYCNDFKQIKERLSEAGEYKTTVIQEYIKGFGCGFYGIYDGGRLVSHFMHRRIQEFPINGGVSAVAESYYDEKLFEYGNKLCQALNWHGPIMVEFKYDIEKRDYKLIEINPKLWGSLDLTIGAGIDVPRLLIDIAFQRQISNQEYKQIRYHWIFPHQYKVLLSSLSPKNCSFFIRSCFAEKTNLNFADPWPTSYQILRGLMEGMKVLVSSKARFPHGRIKD